MNLQPVRNAYSTVSDHDITLFGGEVDGHVLAPSGVLVAGFFDSEDDVAAFDHKVTTAYRWPADVFPARLAEAGLVEVQRLQHAQEGTDRRYAVIAARAS